MTLAAPETTAQSDEVVIIRPHTRWFQIEFGQLWRFRDLLFALAWRDIRLRYRQTLLGVVWVILQPLLGALIFAVVFGIIAKMPSGGTPYIAISYSGLIGWTLFSTTLTRIGTCLVANAELIRKVYFPRLLLPLGIVPCTLIDFVFSAIFMALIMIIYGILPGWGLVLFPVCALILIGMAVGIGMIAGSLAVQYRDVGYILPLFVQLLMFASPVGYSASAVPAYLKHFYDLNPLVAPIEIMRWSLIGVGHPNFGNLGYSVAVTVALMALGLVVFKLTERKFADVI
jgi:lipopolysaccharide transport system permease protein